MNEKLKNIATLLVTVISFYVILEVFVWRPMLPQIPLSLHENLGRLKPLAQVSKAGVVPKDYILVIGDSYAEGLGDWLLRVVGDGNPPHSAADGLHQKTGRDVLAFGFRGGHPTLTYVFQTTQVFAGMNLYWGIDVASPKDVVAYFYEGNGINDELANLDFYMGPAFNRKRAGERA